MTIEVAQKEFIDHIWDKDSVYFASEDRQGNIVFYKYIDII